MVELIFGVIGNPVDHSLSPKIHYNFASQFNLNNFSYKKIKATHDDFEITVREFFQNNGSGLNITVPFKNAAYNICDVLDSSAMNCGSVNTIKYESGKLKGYSTDGSGFVDDISSKNIQLDNKKILIYGAGGSASSLISAILENEKTAIVSILNRTPLNAEKLLSFFKSPRLLPHTNQSTYDIIVNTTPISMNNGKITLPYNLLSSNTICYDLFYSNDKTAFQKWAIKNGAKLCYDGLGMLIHQAKHSFNIWNNLIPDKNNLESLLRAV